MPIPKDNQTSPPFRKIRVAVPKFAKFVIHIYIGAIKKTSPVNIPINLFMCIERKGEFIYICGLI